MARPPAHDHLARWGTGGGEKSAPNHKSSDLRGGCPEGRQGGGTRGETSAEQVVTVAVHHIKEAETSRRLRMQHGLMPEGARVLGRGHVR